MRALLGGVLGAIATFGLAAGEDEPADELLGQWYTEDNESKVEVVKKDGKFFGKIIWLSEPNYGADEPDGDAGKPKRDKNNPDKLSFKFIADPKPTAKEKPEPEAVE